MLKKYNPLDDSILAQLRQHMLEGKAVHLHNTFRGLPVRNNGIIRMVSQAFLAIDTQPEQCVCLLNEKRTIITGKFLAITLAWPYHGYKHFSVFHHGIHAKYL